MHASIDHRISAIATPQHGCISWAQLRALGLSPNAIRHRTKQGRMYRMHRGVYVVGHQAVTHRTLMMAAVLAVGDDAVVDLRAAAVLYQSERRAWKRWKRRQRIVICILTTRQVRINDPGICVRRTRCLPPADVTVIDGIPTVSSSRLVCNIAATEPQTVTVKLIDELAFHDHLDIGGVRACATRLAARSGRGLQKVEDALNAYVDGEHGTDSELEEMARRWVATRNVRTPRFNVYRRIPGLDKPIRIDMVWDDEMVCVEVDGFGHGRPTRRRDDQRRRAALRAAGWTVIVMTRERLTDPAERERWGRRLERAVNGR